MNTIEVNNSPIIDILKEKANCVGKFLFGEDSFDATQAEREFKTYLSQYYNSLKIPEYNNQNIQDFINAIQAISGFGNPLSPIIFLGNEFAFDDTEIEIDCDNCPQENKKECKLTEEDKKELPKSNMHILYFLYTIDFLWKYIFYDNMNNSNFNNLIEKFINEWNGPIQEGTSKNPFL